MNKTDNCSCGDCTAEDLPVNPFEALRVSQGMLLAEDDFRVMLGNPRGKQMVHNAWLHGSGVVWGMDVRRDGLLGLVVEPGLALDGQGRELVLSTSHDLDLARWVDQIDDGEKKQCGTRKVRACLVVEFDCETARDVPVLADPCDVGGNRNEPSRIIESARVSLLPGRCPPCRTGYHRLRVLFGLERASAGDRPGREAQAARDEVLALPPDQRPAEMLRRMGCLAAADAADLCAGREEGASSPLPFPVANPDAAVVLACVKIRLRDDDGCTTVDRVTVDECCRCTLVPTATITDLLAGMATHLVGAVDDCADTDEGPRIRADHVEWQDDRTRLVLPVNRALAGASLRRRAVSVTSLTAKGWSEHDVDSVQYDAERLLVVVELDRPVEGLVRVVVKGTGPTPVYGVSPAAPLAGVVGGPPVVPQEGRDAVLTLSARRSKGDAS
jgi:hypothetical protein